MSREITVILKKPEDETKPVSKSQARKVWDFCNEFVKAPLFIFIIGTSFVSFWPAIRDRVWPEPPTAKDAREKRERIRSDVAAIIPLVSYLDKPGSEQARAASALLKELATAAKTQPLDEKEGYPPIYQAVIDVATITDAKDKMQPADVSAEKINPPSAKPVAPPPVSKEETLAAIAARLQSVLVYIQVSSSNDEMQTKARASRTALQNLAISAPGVESVAPTKTPDVTQVRYFNDGDKAKASDLAAFVTRTQGITVNIAKIDIATVKPGTLELWFGK